MYRFFVPCQWRCQATVDPSWLGPLALVILGAWGFGTLLALPLVTGVIDFGVRRYRHRRTRVSATSLIRH